jgi:hypothetical protein
MDVETGRDQVRRVLSRREERADCDGSDGQQIGLTAIAPTIRMTFSSITP